MQLFTDIVRCMKMVLFSVTDSVRTCEWFWRQLLLTAAYIQLANGQQGTNINYYSLYYKMYIAYISLI